MTSQTTSAGLSVSESPRAVLFTALEVETSSLTAHLADVAPVRWGDEVHQRGRFMEGLGWEVSVVQTEPENQTRLLQYRPR